MIGLRKVLITLLTIIVLFFPYNNIYAETVNDLENKLSRLQANYNAAKAKANMTQSEINKLKESIAVAEAEIRTTQSEITKAEENIKESQDDIEEKKEQTNQLLLYLQLSSDEDSYFEYIFEADDYTDFIYRYEAVNQLSDYNNKLIDELNVLISNLEKRKVELADKQKSLSEQKANLQSKYAIMQVQLKEENDDSIDIQQQITALQKRIKSAKQRCGTQKNIDINSCGGSAAAVDGWVYPLIKFRQSSNYGWDENRYHYAVDLATSEYSEVKAVGNGEVISAGLTTERYSCTTPLDGYSNVYYGCHCGGYVIQIKHTDKNGSNYVSLYMHLITSYVKVGDVVTAGQKIADSGGGWAEFSKWHDQCTGGAHLHFTMSYGSGYIGASNLQGSTFNPVKFFPAMRGIGSYYNGG